MPLAKMTAVDPIELIASIKRDDGPHLAADFQDAQSV
jgi:hypothetical protein